MCIVVFIFTIIIGYFESFFEKKLKIFKIELDHTLFDSTCKEPTILLINLMFQKRLAAHLCSISKFITNFRARHFRKLKLHISARSLGVNF